MLCAEIDTLHPHLMFTKFLWKICWHPPFTGGTPGLARLSAVKGSYIYHSPSDLRSFPLTCKAASGSSAP